MDLKRIFREVSVKLGYYSKPSFLIIGAQKAGTTGLFDILNHHTKIRGTKKKELHYFDFDDIYFKRRLNDYHILFDPPYRVPKGTLLFEATPCYLYHKDGARRLFEYNPNLKVIGLLRNPTKRAFSAWTMYHHNFNNDKLRRLHDPRDFSTVISDEMSRLESTHIGNDNRSYISRGIYYQQVKQYMDIFPKENILFMESEYLKRNHEEAISKVLNFLQLPHEMLPKIISNHAQKDDHSIYLKELQMLQEFYKPHNQALYQLMGEEFNWDNAF